MCAGPSRSGDAVDRAISRANAAAPAAGERSAATSWRIALGRRERFEDWAALFGDELSEAPWQEVLDRWVARLAPGFCAAATHGVIRVGHAARGLAAGETPQPACASSPMRWPAGRRPGSNCRPSVPAPRSASWRRARRSRECRSCRPRARRPAISSRRWAALDDFAEFAPVDRYARRRGAVALLIAELTEVFARVYLANARNIPTTIAFIHAVTSHAALGNIAPHVSDATARAALRYAWQAGLRALCLLWRRHGDGRGFRAARYRMRSDSSIARSAMATSM